MKKFKLEISNLSNCAIVKFKISNHPCVSHGRGFYKIQRFFQTFLGFVRDTCKGNDAPPLDSHIIDVVKMCAENPSLIYIIL